MNGGASAQPRPAAAVNLAPRPAGGSRGALSNIEYEYRGGDTVEEVRRCFEYCRDALTS